MTIGERIKSRRNELGYTQMELALKMGYKNKSAICNVEKNGNNITSDRIAKFAEVLDCTPAYLMGWTEQEFNDSLNPFPFLPSASESDTNKAPKGPIHYDITDSEYTLISKYRTLTLGHREMIDKMIDEFSNIDTRTEMPGQTSLLPFA